MNGNLDEDPVAGFVTDTVEDELAYRMESLGVAADVMRRRVEETLDLLGLVDLRDRPLLSLSGWRTTAGRDRRGADRASEGARPRRADVGARSGAAEDVLAALPRLVHDLSMTVLIAEHRLERVVQYADRVSCSRPTAGLVGAPADVIADSPVTPPIVELGRLAGLVAVAPVGTRRPPGARLAPDASHDAPPPRADSPARAATPVAQVRGLVVAYDGQPALRGVDLDLRPGEIVAIMGRNGAGKSTLLASLAGLRKPAGPEHHQAAPDRVGLVPQEPGDLLWAQTVEAECATPTATRMPLRAPPARCSPISLPTSRDEQHPRDLSEGQRLSLVAGGRARRRARPCSPSTSRPEAWTTRPSGGWSRILQRLADDGHGVLIATHDVELVAEVADRMVVLADGEIVSEGPAREVAVSSPVFAPQVVKGARAAASADRRRRRARAGAGPMSAISAVKLRPRSALALFAASVVGVDRLRLAAARLAAGRPERHDRARQRRAVAVHRAARAAPRRRARRDQRARHRRQGGRRARRAGRLWRGAAPAVRRRHWLQLRVLPADPRRAGARRNFGFVLGAVTLLASALLTGQVGPWLPFEMLGCAWTGFGAGCLPAAHGPGRDRDPRGVRRGVRPALRAAAQPVVLAVRALPAATDRLRARRVDRARTSCTGSAST